MGCTYRCEKCESETTVVHQSTALDLLCHCGDRGAPMDYVGNTETEYVGHEQQRDYELRE